MADLPSDARTLPTSSHWGAGVVTLSEGRLVSVRPHPDDPAPSRINENIAGGLNGRARVRRPAVRQSYLAGGPLGRTGERGAEPFVEVSWETALGLIAGELVRIRANYGNEAIYAGSYGWASAGRFHHAQSQLKRFLNAAGGFVRSEGNYSYNAALVLMPYVVGNFRDHVKQATRWSVIAREGRLVVMFGGIPLRNAQVSGGGVGRHRLGEDLADCARAGVEFVNFSPLRGDAAEGLNAEWLPPRPGSDTAIMMGLAHTLLAEGLHDAAFLARYCVGFDVVAAYLRGETDGIVKDADWAAAQSGIAAERLRALARQMAAGRTLICTAVALQRADHGEQPLWMTVVLAAMLGQIGLPGGGFGIGYGGDASMGTMGPAAGLAGISARVQPGRDLRAGRHDLGDAPEPGPGPTTTTVTAAFSRTSAWSGGPAAIRFTTTRISTACAVRSSGPRPSSSTRSAGPPPPAMPTSSCPWPRPRSATISVPAVKTTRSCRCRKRWSRPAKRAPSSRSSRRWNAACPMEPGSAGA